MAIKHRKTLGFILKLYPKFRWVDANKFDVFDTDWAEPSTTRIIDNISSDPELVSIREVRDADGKLTNIIGQI